MSDTAAGNVRHSSGPRLTQQRATFDTAAGHILRSRSKPHLPVPLGRFAGGLLLRRADAVPSLSAALKPCAERAHTLLL